MPLQKKSYSRVPTTASPDLSAYIVKKKAPPAVDTKVSDIGVTALAYITMDSKLKALRDQKEDFKQKLLEHIDQFKNKKKPHESYQTVVTHAGKKVELRMTARSTTHEKEDWLDVVNTKFKKYAKRLIGTVEFLNIDELELLVLDGSITEDEAKLLVDVVTNHAFTPKIIK